MCKYKLEKQYLKHTSSNPNRSRLLFRTFPQTSCLIFILHKNWTTHMKNFEYLFSNINIWKILKYSKCFKNIFCILFSFYFFIPLNSIVSIKIESPIWSCRSISILLTKKVRVPTVFSVSMLDPFFWNFQLISVQGELFSKQILTFQSKSTVASEKILRIFNADNCIITKLNATNKRTEIRC